MIGWPVLTGLLIWAYLSDSHEFNQNYFPHGWILPLMVAVWVVTSGKTASKYKKWLWAFCPLLVCLAIEWQVYAASERLLNSPSRQLIEEYAVRSFTLMSFLLLWIVSAPMELEGFAESFRSRLAWGAIALITAIAAGWPGISETVAFFSAEAPAGLTEFQALQSSLLHLSLGLYIAFMVRALVPVTIGTARAWLKESRAASEGNGLR
jgi:hypothetical protein